jgi:Cof subfamily protein (haloacid dehalogenase superfamily)
MTYPPERVDIRLIASDMDGTLLDADGQVPERFWPLLERILAAGIVFVPASGRQYQTLEAVFGHREGLVYIAENGTNIVRDGVSIALETVVPSIISPVLDWVRDTASTGADLGVVVCGARTAYIERSDEEFVSKVRPYYAALEIVDDVVAAAADDDVLKLAIFDLGRAESRTGPAVIALGLPADVVISGENWVDIMRPGANKGKALIRLQEHLGIGREQTMAFGDYLNDAELLDAAQHSYAMANAHQSIRDRARHQAPSNIDEGVITSILVALPELAPALA